jgi:hypothetical protein
VNDYPKIIQEVGFDFHWSEEKVWALEIPAEEMDISELEWHFDIPFWDNYTLKPNDVLKDSAKYKEEFERTIQSDLFYPLDIMWWKNRWVLLDGLHRLLKAKHLGMQKVMIRKIPIEAISQIKK